MANIDYSKLSDADLDKMLQEKQKFGKPLAEMSDAELDSAYQKHAAAPSPQAPAEAPGLLSRIGKTIDSYTGAPVRAGIGAAQEGNNPFAAGWKQFGEDPSKAPTGKDIVMKAGVPDKVDMTAYGQRPQFLVDEEKKALGDKVYAKTMDSRAHGATPADILGTGMDLATDPTNYAPILGSEKIGGGLLKAAESSGALAKGEQLASSAKGMIGKATAKVGSALTGVPEDAIKTYAAKTDKINEMVKASGGDLASMSDATKAKIVGDIQSTKSSLGKTIGTELSKLGDAKTLDVKPLQEALDASQSKLATKIKINPALGKDFEDLNAYIKNVAVDGKVSPLEMHALKEAFQEEAKAAYMNGGQIFSRGNDAQNAAKQVARLARQSINEAAPEVAQANNKLAELHSIEKNLNRNVLKEGGSSAALESIGSGTNPQQAKLLGRIGTVTGTNPVESAKDLSAAKYFGNAQLLPVDTTGKAALRSGVGYGAGKVLSHMTGIPGLQYPAAALTSPAVLKGLINAKAIPERIAAKGLLAAKAYLATSDGQNAAKLAIKAGLLDQNPTGR